MRCHDCWGPALRKLERATGRASCWAAARTVAGLERTIMKLWEQELTEMREDGDGARAQWVGES